MTVQLLSITPRSVRNVQFTPFKVASNGPGALGIKTIVEYAVLVLFCLIPPRTWMNQTDTELNIGWLWLYVLFEKNQLSHNVVALLSSMYP